MRARVIDYTGLNLSSAGQIIENLYMTPVGIYKSRDPKWLSHSWISEWLEFLDEPNEALKEAKRFTEKVMLESPEVRSEIAKDVWFPEFYKHVYDGTINLKENKMNAYKAIVIKSEKDKDPEIIFQSKEYELAKDTQVFRDRIIAEIGDKWTDDCEVQVHPFR